MVSGPKDTDEVLMRTISKFLVILIILFHAALLYAGDLRVMVSMFESKDPDKELGRRMAIVSSQEVVRSKGFRYISPTEYTKIATENEKIAVDKTPDIEKEYSDENIEYLQKMSEPYKDKSFDNFFRGLESVDIIIGGSVQRDGPLVSVDLMMNNGRNQKQYNVTVKCEEGRLDAEMRKTVMDLLQKISRPAKIYADKLINAEKSVVTYLVKTADNREITVEMDYTGDRPAPQVQNVKILPPNGMRKNGVVAYQVKSDEGRIIDIEFAFKNGEADSVKVDTPIPDPSKETKQSEILTMKSCAGYALKFEFVWDKGEMQSAQIYPVLNPFGDHDG